MATEDSLTMSVGIGKSVGISLANPVTFVVSPLTVDQALDRGIISSFPVDSVRAGKYGCTCKLHHTITHGECMVRLIISWLGTTCHPPPPAPPTIHQLFCCAQPGSE